jgi:hypothetical protein
MKTLEPVAVINSVVSLVEAAVAVGVGFGLDLKPEQVGLLMAFVVAVGNLAKTMWARSQVTPTTSLSHVTAGAESRHGLRPVATGATAG